MADDEVVEDLDADEEINADEEIDDEEFDGEDVGALAGDDVDEDVPATDEEDEEEEEVAAAPAKTARRAEDEEEDDDEADPDDVEEDLDTILRDRIAAGSEDEEDEEEEEVVVEDRSGDGDGVSPRRPEEVSCPECFLLVRRSQFTARRTDCPGGLDSPDCPMTKVFLG